MEDPTRQDTRNTSYARQTRAFAAAIALALCAESALAQCQESDRSRHGSLRLRGVNGCTVAPALDTSIDLTISGMIARTRVTQSFHNASDDWVEGTYVFPLPQGAAVDHLVMYVGSRVIEGRIEERGQAREAYEQARDRGYKASLLEQTDGNVFRTSIANIAPGESIEIDIELQHLVRYDDGEFRLRFPTVVGPRYFADRESGEPPQGEGPTEDPIAETTSSLTRTLQPINPLHLELTIDAGVPIRSIYSPTHQIDSAELETGGHLVVLRNDTFADRDFVLAWRPELSAAPTTALFHEEVDGEIYALMMVLPPDENGSADTLAPQITREVVFVIDSSGSMGGNAIGQAKLSLLLALDQLNPGDWFDVIDFDSEARSLFGRSVAANADTIDQARTFVDSLDANGGTNIAHALELALMTSDPPANSAKTTDPTPEVRQVVFITDGAVGNESEIFRQVSDELGDTRLFTVGIGSAPNSHFMRKAAAFGRGTYTYISAPEEISQQMGVLFEKLESAALTDIKIDWNDIAGSPETFPRTTPDLYRGEPLLVTARLGYEPDTVDIAGAYRGQPWSMSKELRATNLPGVDHGIARLWARQKIDSRMDDLALGANSEEVREDVIDLALRHNLVSRYTSLVAIDVSATAPAGAAQYRSLPLNHPAGTLPNTATPATMHAIVALLISLLALALHPESSGGKSKCVALRAGTEGDRHA